MKRHESLVPLSRDHHFGLIMAQRLILGRATNPRADWPTDRAQQATRLVEFFKSDLRAHFDIEETHVFPAAGRSMAGGDREPDRGRRHWTKNAVARDAVYANRRRIRGTRGVALLRRRSEHLERPNAHLYDTGGMRHTHLRGHANILKRLLVHTGAFNLGLLMRTLIGVGTPRGLQGRVVAVLTLVGALWTRLIDCWRL